MLGVKVCLGTDWHIVRTQQILVTIIDIIVVIIIFYHLWHVAISLKWVGNQLFLSPLHSQIPALVLTTGSK